MEHASVQYSCLIKTSIFVFCSGMFKKNFFGLKIDSYLVPFKVNHGEYSFTIKCCDISHFRLCTRYE